jgi:hypothetical protein
MGTAGPPCFQEQQIHRPGPPGWGGLGNGLTTSLRIMSKPEEQEAKVQYRAAVPYTTQFVICHVLNLVTMTCWWQLQTETYTMKWLVLQTGCMPYSYICFKILSLSIPSKSFTNIKWAAYQVWCNEDHYRPLSSNLLKEQSSLHSDHNPISLMTFTAIFESYTVQDCSTLEHGTNRVCWNTGKLPTYAT